LADESKTLVALKAEARALVVYSRVGGGHLSAARALAAELEGTGRCSARLVDVYVDCGRWPVTRFPSIYAELARNHPHLWWLIYRAASRRLNPNWIIGRFVRPRLHQLVMRERPDLIVSALPAVNGLLTEAARAVGARLEVVLTDWHSVHPYWTAPGVDHYTTPTESARDDCVKYGAPLAAIDVVGIPVRREFAATAEHPRPTGRFTILAMMGAEGSPRALRNVAALADADLDAQLIVVCGRNEDLRHQIMRLRARVPMRVFGFVDEIGRLMRSSDLLVTKAGGVTLAEAFCSNLPVVIHDVLPGQEAGNLEYVLAQGGVAYAPTPAALVRTVEALIADAARRDALAACGARLARPNATQEIAANLLRRLDAARA
jgi:1,2-diacylglycerol 3-beta-galactosyltransferase